MRNLFLAALLIVIALLGSSCTRYDGTTTAILTDLNIDFEITDELNTAGYMDKSENKVYVKRSKQSTLLVLHEAVHMLRHDANIMLDVRTEEIVACKAAYKITKMAGISSGMSKYMLPAWINACIEANGEVVRRLTDEENDIIEVEVEKSIQLVIERLKENGKSMTDIDWTKTAILLIL